MLALPVFPSLAAVIVAAPGEKLIISALVPDAEDTSATAGLLLLQVTIRYLRMLPLASRGSDTNRMLAPTGSVEDTGVTFTEVTGIELPDTNTMPTPLAKSTVARMCASPAVSAVTIPAFDTVATAGVSVDQAIGRPLIGFPTVSNSETVSCSCEPIGMATVSGSTIMWCAAVPTTVVPVVNDTEVSAAKASPVRSFTPWVTTNWYSVCASSGAAASNTAAVAVPPSRLTVPATAVVPWNNCTDDVVIVAPATGSLNTTTIRALSG